MKKHLFAFLLGICLCSSLVITAEENVPFRVQRVNERIMFLTPGKYAPPATMTVLATKKGLIVIDTLLSPTLAEQAMQQIKKELGRDDVILVINTHDHLDHTGGNQVFKGIEIVGHENVAPAMKRHAEGTAANLPRMQFRIGQRARQLQGLAADAPQALSLAEANRIDRLMMDDMQKRFIATPPTKTFADKLVMQAGGLELRLYHFGRAHTDSDIVIHVPELGILFTGDLFHTDAIGATANARQLDIPRWLTVLDEVLKTGKGVKTVVGGHMLVYKREWLDAQHRYIKELWAAVTQAKKAGASLAAFRRSTPLEPAFSFLAPHFDLKAKQSLDRHQENVQAFWRVGLQPAAAEIERVMSESGLEAARTRFRELHAAGEREFFIDETEFNALGYRFLQQEGKANEAITVFEMNSEAFPGSWNAWDSLGEAWLANDEFGRAEACYVKSLELNPDSPSGRDALDRIRLDFKNETRQAVKFAPGENTKLKGPYLGQTPPGLTPMVFAPGIISTAGNFEFSIAFSPDGKEIYFTRRRDPGGLNTMMTCRWEKECWTAPEEAAFCRGFASNEPHITPDGKKLYFGCRRQRPGEERLEYGNIWVAERTGSGWGEPRYHSRGMYVSSTQKGDLYMTDVTNVAGGGIIKFTRQNGVYGAAEKAPAVVNEPGMTAHAFIVPDESYIVFDAGRPGGQGGEGDLYVVFRNNDGSWSDAVNLGDTINTPGTNFCPMVSPDGKYLFYSAGRDIYWVSAEVIHRLRPSVEKKAGAKKEPEVEQDLSKLASLDAIDDLAASYFEAGQIDKVIEAFEYAKSRFPAELYTIIRRLVFYNAQAEQFDKVMDNWELGQSKGLFFPAESKVYEPLFQTERYRKFLAANKELLNTTRRNAKAKYDVVLPEGYDGKKKYPLFIVMHGNNINSAMIMPKWKLGKLAGRFILVFLQSSQTVGSESFIWDDLPVGRRDVAACWAWAQGQYRIDRTRVLVGGFSGGAAMAIDAVLRQVIPAAGFIALCPGGVLPGRADMEIFKEAAGKNITGQIIAGEKDDPEEAKALVDLFAEAGLHIGLTVVPGLEHTFPVDLPERLDSAVDLILKHDNIWVSAEVIHRLRPVAAPQASLGEEIKKSVLAGDLPGLQVLLRKDPALLKAGDAQGRTPLHMAAAAGHLEMTRWLIERGAELDARTVQMSTPLMHAALSGKTEVVRLLISKGAVIDARDSYQRSAFILVARDSGDAEMAKILLDAGADMNAADRWNDTALSLAAWRGFSGLVDLLLERGATLPGDPVQKQLVFTQAIANGLDRLFDRILASGADISAEDSLGGSLLHAAADGGSVSIMKTLLEKKLDKNGKDRNGWTPLHRAAERGFLPAATLLIERGARLDERTLAGETPYNLAAAEKNAEVVALLKSRGADISPTRFPELNGEFLGQKKPGAKPELFAPGIVSGRFGLHCPAIFSPDGRELYWSLMIAPRTGGYSTGRLLVSRLEQGRWTYPQIAPFTGESRDADVPFFSPDNKRLYFMSRRPLPGTDKPSGEHIWYMERQGSGWSEARPVDALVNDLPHHWQFSVDKDYNLYFATTIAGGQGKNDIYCSRYADGRYQQPRNLGAPVNSTGGEEMPFIAPDGSYLLFMREFDLYVSFRSKDNSWRAPFNLGPEINSGEMDLCPVVSADGKYLFFLSGRGGASHTWWVSAKVIDKLRTGE